MTATRRAIVLPVVLVLIGLLALVMAGFVFFMRSEMSGLSARRDTQQARLAAESGLQEVILALRTADNDPKQWFDVPDVFRHVLVYSEAFEREDDPVRQQSGSREQYLEENDLVPPAWRFSVVAPSYDGQPDTMRYGITPEASKMNINGATEEELTALVEPILYDLGLENAPELVACMLDWLDEDDEERPNGAESTYYNTLEPGYYAKNGPVDTLEELLLVKGFSAAVLYGEDVNRNGILDQNEDDGDESFPYYDNADGILDYGIAPFLTVWSSEPGGEGENVAGKINVNTAPLRVLQAIGGMTPDGAEQIVAMRQEFDADALLEADWVQTSGALDSETYEAVKDRLTVQALQFHVEILGYADHVPIARRYEWVLEMRGPIAQVLYHRDLTRLGFAWPIDEDTFMAAEQ